jgi:7,8-dihydropterin-6-yl-methyl-4-(beta-D-ribofuranosyl)aminobenzene 5'-phosphate synthase
MPATVALQPVDAVDVTVLVDNFVDILIAGSEIARRAPVPRDFFAQDREHLIAEHGYALLVEVEQQGRRHSLLYDAGLGRDTLLHNMDVLDISSRDLRAIVLSHGHADHHGGLEGIARRVGRLGMPLLLHPDARRERKFVLPTGAEIHLPPPSVADLEREGIDVVEERGPTLLIDGTALVSGQVERVTDFEKGLPPQQARTEGGWEPDPWVWDDQGMVLHVRNQGLVVLSGCSHAGAINVIRHAQRLTGVDSVHAFVGGLHLSGSIFEAIIPQTIEELVSIKPAVLVPGHCTGWRATQELARALPEAFIQTSVGTRFHFAADAA